MLAHSATLPNGYTVRTVQVDPDATDDTCAYLSVSSVA